MKKVGQLLKEARMQKNLSIQDIAFALKISGRTLIALEESDEKELPARAFVRGFAKSYAKYLKLENEEFNLSFQSEFGEPDSKRNMVTPSTPTTSAATASLEAAATPKRVDTSVAVDGSKKVEVEDELSQLNHDGSKATLIYGAFAFALVIAIGVAQRVIEKYQKETLISETEKQAAANSATPVEEVKKEEAAPATTAATSATPADPSANATPAAATTPAANSTSASAPMSTSAQTTTPASTPAATATETKPTAAPVAEVKKEAEPVTPPPAPAVVKKPEPKIDVTAGVFKLASVEVVVEALGDIEIEYSSKTDGKGKLKLAKGQLHIFKSKNGLRLSINDGGSAKLAVNGKDVGVAGAPGKSVSITY